MNLWKKLCVLLALLALLSCGGDALAADSLVRVDGSDTVLELFDDLTELMPGDTRTRHVVIQNASEAAYARLLVRALPVEDPDEAAFLAQLHMTVTQGDTVLFDAAPAETSSLTDDVLLGNLRSGETVVLDMTLTVPLELDDRYAGRTGHVAWQFTVDELAGGSSAGRAAKTGDENAPLLWCAMLACCALSLAALVRRRHSKR